MLEYLVEWDVLFVLSLYVEQDRRQGTATKLMNMLLEEAKELDVDVDLLVQVMIDELKRRKKKTSTMIELDLGEFLDE